VARRDGGTVRYAVAARGVQVPLTSA
jgi:hypothetical protein